MKRKTANTIPDDVQTKKILEEYDRDKQKEERIKQKEKEKENKEVLKNIELSTLNLIPIKKKIGDGSIGFELENGIGFINIFKLMSFDYFSFDDAEVADHISIWDKFHRTFANDNKLISVNMPVDMTSNIKFYLQKYKTTSNPLYKSQIAEYLKEFMEDLRYREIKDFYLYIYAETEDELIKANKQVEETLCATGLAYIVSVEQKKNVFKKYSNPFSGSSIVYKE